MELIRNIGYLATCRKDGAQSEIHPIQNAALAWEGKTIKWVGLDREIPSQYNSARPIDAQGKLVIPGLIDCHTHLAFGGWRADEFEARIKGKSYSEIAKEGGGILKTVRLTRETSEHDLVQKCLNHLHNMVALGVTTVECKSGYGLTVADEIKLLRVYRTLAEQQPIEIVSTLLGAHTFPAEFKEKPKEYIKLLCEKLIPRVAQERLAEFCDVFVEDIAFSIEDAKRIFGAATEHGLSLKLHADQLKDGGSSELAAKLGAVSADHLEHVSDNGIKALGKSETVAVILPFASLYLRAPSAPGRKLIDAGAKVAVATDFNPGSAPSYHLPLALTLACTLNGLTPSEALKGATINAARALRREATVGSLEPGKQADFCLIDSCDVNQWLYNFKENQTLLTVKRGERIFVRHR